MKNFRLNSPEYLGRKLLEIRNYLGLSQSEMLVELGLKDILFRSNISQYELGRREPPLKVLLSYARLVKISVDVIIDDDLELPFSNQNKS